MTILWKEYDLKRILLLFLVPLSTSTSVLSLIILIQHRQRQILPYAIGEILSVVAFSAQVFASSKKPASFQISTVCLILGAVTSGLSLCGGIAWIDKMLIARTLPNTVSLALVPLFSISLPLKGIFVFLMGSLAITPENEDCEKQNPCHTRAVSFKPSALTLVEKAESDLYADTSKPNMPCYDTHNRSSYLRTEKAAIANLSDSLLPPHLQQRSSGVAGQAEFFRNKVDVASEKLQMVTNQPDQLKGLGDIPLVMPKLMEPSASGAKMKVFPFSEWKKVSPICAGGLDRNGGRGSHFVEREERDLERCSSAPSWNSMKDHSFKEKRDITGSTTSSQQIESEIVQYIEHNVESGIPGNLSISEEPVMATPASSPAKPRKRTSPLKKFRDLKQDVRKHHAKKSSCNFDCLHDTTTPLNNKKRNIFRFKHASESQIDNEWGSCRNASLKATPESNTSCPSSIVGEYDKEKWNTIRSRLESARSS